MPTPIDAATAKAWLSDGAEIAFLDVREPGQYGEGHPFFAIPLPYSVFELRLPDLAPNPAVRLVLLDDGDEVAVRAAGRAEAMGYTHVHFVRGGAGGWKRAGFTLFAGVNVPSKTFGELIEHQRHTPRITAGELDRLRKSGEKLVIVDGRPLAEYGRMNIPGGVCCPNGELALRIGELVRDADTRIVVNCAGRTRSIIGAETLRALGLPNPIAALENGTQGWFLAGLQLENGSARTHSGARPSDDVLAARAARLRAAAEHSGAGFADRARVAGWLAETGRTTFLLDVRSPEEHAARSIEGAVPAPGGQLIQATDQWVGVKGARLVLIDDDGVRAPMVAQWLAQLGHETWVLDGGAEAATGLRQTQRPVPGLEVLPAVSATAVVEAMRRGVPLLDLRASAAYRAGHVAGARWSIRPRLDGVKPGAANSGSGSGSGSGSISEILVAGPRDEVAVAARDLVEAGWTSVRHLDGGPVEWTAAGLDVVTSPADPPDSERIDFLFFVHDRHDGNAAAARRYLEWETGLLAQLDEQERSVFRIVG